MAKITNEEKFLTALRSLFMGSDVEGESGFINLMHIKNRHFNEYILPKLTKEIDKVGKKKSDFREEMFDKLLTFFSRYFCESGSIYFRDIPVFYPVRERVYGSGNDMELVWRSRDLYYVKSDYLINSMPVEWEDNGKIHKFHFDASKMEHRKNNERRNFYYQYEKSYPKKKKIDDAAILLKVSYLTGVKKLKTDKIVADIQKDGWECGEEDLIKAISIFQRQTEAGFFVHKNASSFLHEQFDMWMYQYMMREENDFDEGGIFDENRLRQLRQLQSVAKKIIDFIAQFEDELVRVWRKPKFVRDVNYVITLNKLNPDVIKKISKHKGAKEQVKEWLSMKFVADSFVFSDIVSPNKIKKKHSYLPLDTRHFKGLESDILECLGNLDESLDGEMIKSDNWQALNTVREKYSERIKCIYIDPPFNLDSSDQFEYRTNYKNDNWATMLENRLALARDFLTEDGVIFSRCDYNGNWIMRCLLDSLFGCDNFKNEISVNRNRQQQYNPNKFNCANDSLFLYGNGNSAKIVKVTRDRLCSFCQSPNPGSWHLMVSPGETKTNPQRTICGEIRYPPRGMHWKYVQEKIDIMEKEGRIRINPDGVYTDTRGERIRGTVDYKQSPDVPLDDDWTDIKGYVINSFSTENAPELLERVINVSTTNNDEIVFDFFSGSGTTQAVAQQLGRKWLGVEMGEHFHTVIIPRLKKVIAGKQSGVNKEVKYEGGGAFKYYALEQYEETLNTMCYKDYVLLDAGSKNSVFSQYIFMADKKQSYIASVKDSGKKATIKMDMSVLYGDIDLAETVANAKGSMLRHQTQDIATYADNTTQKLNLDEMSEAEKIALIKLLRPYLWWGE